MFDSQTALDDVQNSEWPAMSPNDCLPNRVTSETLSQENRRFHNTGGVSCNNRAVGFQSAFIDTATGCVYLSCFANGRPAPIHVLDGLPNELVLQRNVEGRVTAVKQTIVAGFLAAGEFYTREQAAQLIPTLLGE